MIQNEHQYKVTQGEVKKLQQAVEKLLEQAEAMLPVQVAAIKNSFQHQIDRMQAELREYDGLKAGKVEITMGAIEDLPKVLIQKRISLGMTQKELAEKLGIKEQMVQRYESTGYESISYQRLVEIWNALEASIPIITVRYANHLDLPICEVDTHTSNATIRSSNLSQTMAALTAPEVVLPTDPLASARLRGMKVKQELLYLDGQPLRSEEVAQLLGISRQAVDKRRNKGQLLAVSLGRRGYFYPLWQFRDGAILTGLDRALSALAKFDPWTQLMFMKTGDLRLNDRTPLECLIAGDIDSVVNAAACYGETNPA